jgi:plastocyanin
VRRFSGVLLLACVAGCGGGADTTQTTLPAENVPAAPKATHSVVVRETEFKLDPAQAAGGEEGLVTIQIVNEGKLAHSLAVDGPNGLVEVDGQVEPGQEGTLEADLDRPGTYTWYCPLDGHRGKGMTGSITVGGSNPARGAEPTGTGTTATQTTPTQTQTQTRTETKTVTTPAPTATTPSPTATTGTPNP